MMQNVHEAGNPGKMYSVSMACKTSFTLSIEMKLLEMGWDKKYFPPRWDGRWVALVDQPRELTPRSTYLLLSYNPFTKIMLFSLESYTPQAGGSFGREQDSRIAQGSAGSNG
jgi:hypothetical protein